MFILFHDTRVAMNERKKDRPWVEERVVYLGDIRVFVEDDLFFIECGKCGEGYTVPSLDEAKALLNRLTEFVQEARKQ